MKTILIAVFALCCFAAELVRFQSKSHRYEVAYPAGWIQWDRRDDLFISNYKREDGLRGGLLPLGGATIHVEQKPAELSSLSLDDWVSHDISSVDQKNLIMRAHTNIRKACTEVHQREEVGPHFYYEDISCYFELAGSQFVVTLEYRQDDPRASTYRSAYATVIRSFRRN